MAKRIGAVNTVVKQPDGTLEGRNTDAFGFLEALKCNVPHWTADLRAGGPCWAPAVLHAPWWRA